MREFISKKILVYNPETGKHEPIDAIRGESAYEIAVRTGQTALPEDEWIKQVQNGQIDGDFVKTVNSLHPDEKGNVEIEVGNPDVITTLTRDEFNALTTAQIQKMYADGVRTILVENEMEEGEGTYTISWDGITDKPNAYPPTEHRHEYAENLLKNAEFKIATMGYGGLRGEISYAADCWINENNLSVVEADSGINVTLTNSSAEIAQYIPKHVAKNVVGQPVTMALLLGNGVVCVANGSVPEEGSYSSFIYGINNGILLKATYLPDGTIRAGFASGDDVLRDVNVRYVRFLPGAYTAQNLPPFIPVDPRVEMMKLGIAPVNLLVNSDWRMKDRIINQRGQTVYDGSGYTIDRWQCGNAAGKTKVVDGGIAFSATGSGTCYFIQVVPSEIAEKLSDTTKAVKLAGGAIYAGTNTTVTIPNGAISFFPASSGKWMYQIAVNPYSTVTLEWAALYEGFYAEETLPVFEPIHPRIEMLKLGLPVQPENLLDNPDFAIAQAGYNEAHGSVYYLCDRWISTVASATKLRNGVQFVNNGGIVYQHVAGVAGKTLTFAMKTNGTGEQHMSVYTADLGSMIRQIWGYKNSDGIVCGTATIPSDIDVASFILYPENGSIIEWASLYEGTYTAETLPPYVPRPYAVELAECRRYYLPIEYGPGAAGYIDNTGSTIYVNVPVTQKMREMPSVDYDPAYGTLVIYTHSGKAFKDIKGIAATVNGENYVQVKITFNEAFTVSNVPCFVEAYDKNINMQLNADIK